MVWYSCRADPCVQSGIYGLNGPTDFECACLCADLPCNKPVVLLYVRFSVYIWFFSRLFQCYVGAFLFGHELRAQ